MVEALVPQPLPSKAHEECMQLSYVIVSMHAGTGMTPIDEFHLVLLNKDAVCPLSTTPHGIPWYS